MSRSGGQWISIHRRPTDPKQHLWEAAGGEDGFAYRFPGFNDLEWLSYRAARQSDGCCRKQNDTGGLARAKVCHFVVITRA
jgi:hypothetical protein